MKLTLSGLAVESVTLEPAFDPQTATYNGVYAAGATLQVTAAKASRDACWGQSHQDAVKATVTTYPGGSPAVMGQRKPMDGGEYLEEDSWTISINTTGSDWAMVKIPVSCDGKVNTYTINLTQAEE